MMHGKSHLSHEVINIHRGEAEVDVMSPNGINVIPMHHGINVLSPQPQSHLNSTNNKGLKLKNNVLSSALSM